MFQQLNAWTLQTEPEWRQKNILYMYGQAGLGKSTIAMELCRRLDSQEFQGRHLGASFFFTRDAKGLNCTDHFFPSIAVQLARSQESLFLPIVMAAREYLKRGMMQWRA